MATPTTGPSVPFDGVSDNYEPQPYQKALMYDQALSTWSAKNRIIEALVVRIASCVAKGEDTSKLMDQLERMQKPDPLTEKILNKLV